MDLFWHSSWFITLPVSTSGAFIESGRWWLTLGEAQWHVQNLNEDFSDLYTACYVDGIGSLPLGITQHFF